MKIGKSLPKEIVDLWPEVFGEISLKVIPMKYLYSITITFDDDKVWEIDVTKATTEEQLAEAEKSLKEFFNNYESFITNVDFKINSSNIKRDITKITKKFLKKKKLG